MSSDLNKESFMASETECEICQQSVYAIDLEKINISEAAFIASLWACDECRKEYLNYEK